LGSDLFSFIPTGSPNLLNSYKIGDSFVSLPLLEVQEMLSESTAQIDEEVSKLEESLSGIRDEMKELKVQLYARFGRSINLEAS
jgi:prefoldin subunit 4